MILSAKNPFEKVAACGAEYILMPSHAFTQKAFKTHV